MVVSYDEFASAFLDKIREYDFLDMAEENRTEIIDSYMHRALSEFKKNRKYDFKSTKDDILREFNFSSEPESVRKSLEEDIDEIVNIVSDGMVLQWLKPFKNSQDLLENALNTRDFSTYSPAELLKQIRETYNEVKKEYIQEIREYSYNHMDLGELHL